MKAQSQKAQQLDQYIKMQGYICPLGDYWNQMYKLLPNREQTHNGGWEPPLPLILAAWDNTSDDDKFQRLLSHIAWADLHGAIDDVDKYLRSLSREKWHIASL